MNEKWFEQKNHNLLSGKNYVEMNLSFVNHKEDEYQKKSAVVMELVTGCASQKQQLCLSRFTLIKSYLYILSLFVMLSIVMLAIFSQYVQVTRGREGARG